MFRAMDFACSRCAHRQAEDAACAGCGHDVVQDLRDLRGRQVIHDAESRWQGRRHARFISIGAVVAILLAAGFYAVSYYVFGPELFEDDQILARRRLGKLLVAVALGAAIGVIGVLEMTVGRKRRYPFLDEYERSSPADRQL
jgi:hypothetical protein